MILYLLGLGLISSLHCVGMCIPLHTMVLSGSNGRSQLMVDMSLYHAARIAVYGILGLLISFLNILAWFIDYQVYLLSFVGILLILIAIRQLMGKQGKNSAWQAMIFGKANKLLAYNHNVGMLSLGAVNGLLPCGLVYTAMALSFLNHTWYEGMTGMVAFGLGTLPLLVTVLLSTKYLAFKKYINTSYIEPIIGIVAGVYMIYRAYVFVAPADMQLWDMVLHPVMCH
jgi:sulfite exporter TauE/SafE